MRLYGQKLEDDILYSTKKIPYNPPSGKRLKLSVDDGLDDSLENLLVQEFSPRDAGWDEIEYVNVRISRPAYERIYFGGSLHIERSSKVADDFLISA